MRVRILILNFLMIFGLLFASKGSISMPSFGDSCCQEQTSTSTKNQDDDPCHEDSKDSDCSDCQSCMTCHIFHVVYINNPDTLTKEGNSIAFEDTKPNTSTDFHLYHLSYSIWQPPKIV